MITTVMYILIPIPFQLPYSCEIFRELLLVVIQATEEGKFKTMYVDIVARYFRDFAEITEEDGYIIEDHVSSLINYITL